jgi:DNA-directed RNA polymerase subunit M/transcription elongation factor TFIIS
MSHHDIHEIITQISQSLDCPRCKSRILPHNIVITDIVDHDCMFDVVCHRCKSEMSLSAHIERNTSDTAMTHNQSSQILHNSYIDEGITEAEVSAVRRELRSFCGSFIEVFNR